MFKTVKPERKDSNYGTLMVPYTSTLKIMDVSPSNSPTGSQIWLLLAGSHILRALDSSSFLFNKQVGTLSTFLLVKEKERTTT